MYNIILSQATRGHGWPAASHDHGWLGQTTETSELNILKEFDCITKLNLIQNVDCNASKYLYLKHGFRNTKQLPELLILGDCFFSPSTGAEILSQSAKKVLNFLEMSTNNVSNKAIKLSVISQNNNNFTKSQHFSQLPR